MVSDKRKVPLRAIAALCAAVSAGTCHADPFQLFNLNAQLANGGTLTGRVNLDIGPPFGLLPDDPGFDSTVDLVYKFQGTSLQLAGINNEVGLASGVPGYPVDEVEFRFSDYARDIGFRLGLVTSTPSFGDTPPTYTGQLCVISTGCYYTSVLFPPDSTIFEGSVDVVSGTFTAVATPTPEPGSFVLLGTGLLGVAGVIRKRFAKR